MENRNYHQPPTILDLNNLDEDHEIRMKYDRNGNLISIKKVRRFETSGIWASLFTVALLAALVWHFF